MNKNNFSNEIVQGVGGKENIVDVVHCMTRLRFTLKDDDKADSKLLNSIEKVISTVNKNGQYQIVIGNEVEAVYKDVVNYLDMDVTEKTGNKNEIVKKDNLFNKIVAIVTGSISPVIPILAGAGMGKVLLSFLVLINILTAKSQTYVLLNAIFDTGFYFLPGYIGFSAAKIFGANSYLGAFIGLVTIDPNWVNVVTAGKAFSFLGINVPLVNYASTIIPTLIAVWIMSYIEKLARKIVPDMVKVFIVPLVVMLICAPLTFLVIGPLGLSLSQIIANGSVYLYNNGGFIAIPILAAIYPWLVSTGVHSALGPISISLIATKGFDPIIRVIALCSNMAQASAALCVAIKTKNPKLKSIASAASVTAFLGGITEPALFGVNLKLKKPMYACMIGGFVSGIFAGVMKLKAFVFVTPGILSLPMWMSAKENDILIAIGVIIISSVVTFIATWIIGFDDDKY